MANTDQITFDTLATIKQELPDEVEENNYFISVSQSTLKYEVQDDLENQEYLLRIKDELERIKQEDARVKQEYDTFDNLNSTVKIEEFSEPPIEYQCLICDETVFEKPKLISHILDHGKRFYCKICCKSYLPNKRESHNCVPAELRPFECNICHKRYTERCNLRRHIQIHFRGRTFACDHCSRRFNSKHDLNNHKRYIEGKKDKPFLCDMCHKCYRQICHLERHKLTHTGEKPFRCEICHKRFADNTNLTNHRRSHTDERNYECSVCHKRFKTSSNLINHKRLHTNVRPYKCNICEKTFRKNSNLTSHQKIHKIDQEIDELDVDMKNPPKRRFRKRK